MEKIIKEICLILQFLSIVTVGSICLAVILGVLVGFPVCYLLDEGDFSFFQIMETGVIYSYVLVIFLFLLYFVFLALKSIVMFFINSWKKSGEQHE